MSIQEPAWLKRTRPCPFFSQGRCLFADSCNFLHDVKVRSAVNQPLPSSIQVKQSYFPSKRVFDPPSVVVNSASPPSANLASPQNPASPAQDSSRYSGLLSVLSDVIGPPSDPPTSEVTVPASRAMTTIPSTFQSTAHSPTGLHSGSGSFVAGFEMTTTVADTETGQGASSHTEPSSILEPDPEATLVDPSGYHMESLFPEVDAKFLPNHDGDEFADEGTISYFVEATETFLIGSEAEDDEDDGEYTDEPGDEDPTVILSNRQSTLSSFTGVSLLASPRHSIIGEHAVASSIEDGAVDLLSPVELSAKLRLFPIPSLASKLKRGDSIDSGYADGGSWVGPLSFPHSPPRSFQSPVKFPSHSRRVSRCSPALREKRVSYNVGALRPSPPNPIEVIAEVESEGSLEDNDDTACTILGAYGTLPSKEQGEGGACGSLQVHVAEEKAEEDDKASEVCAVMRIPRRYSPDHLHPTREYDLDSCNQLSFISDDNLSFKTALSTQPSYEDLSDASRVSPIKQDSLFSSISGRSTPNTSVLSHYSDANEHSEQSNFGSHVCESLHPVSQIDSTQAPEERPSEECLLPEEVAIDSNAPFASASADDPQGLATEKVVAPRGSLSGVFRYDSRSPISSPSLDTSHGLSLAMDVRRSAAEMAVASRERLSGVFHFDKQPPKSSPSAELSPSVSCSSTSPGADDHRESAPENVAALRECLHGNLHYDRRSPKSSPSICSYSPSSCKELLGSPAGTSDVREFSPRKRSSGPKPSSCVESPLSRSSVKDVLDYASQDADGMHDRLPVNAIAPRQHLSGGFYFEEHLPKSSLSAEGSHSSSSVKNVLNYASPGACDAQKFVSESDVPSQERLSCVVYSARLSPKSSSFAESFHVPSTVNDVLRCAPADADGNDSRSQEPLPLALHGCLAEYAATEADQTLAVENSLGSDEVTGFSECDSFSQRLSFPLPPFLPAEIVGHSSLGGEEDTSVLSEAAVVHLEEDVLNTYAMSQDEEMERIHSGCDLTEKARPSQLPSVGCLDSDTDFTLRRSRAASDLTVKGKSPPAATPGDTPDISRSPPPPLEQTGRSDSVQSLYDQYFDDGTSDDGSEFLSPAHKDTPPSDVSGLIEESFQQDHPRSLDLAPHLQRVSSSSSGSEPGNSGTDSPRSETVLRPLLTGRRSFLRSPLAELIPKANPANDMESSYPTRTSTRLQAREIGSTMVPLGFRRYRPQPAATKSSHREALRIRTDVARDSPPACSSANHVSFTTRSPLPVKAMSAPPTGGLRQLRLSSIINKRSSILSTNSSSIASSILSLDQSFNSPTPQSPSHSVSSTTSFSHNSLLSSSCEQIPEQIHHTLKRSSSNSLVLQGNDDVYFASQSPTRRDSRSVSAPIQQPKSWRLSQYRAGSRNYTSADGTRRFSTRTSTLILPYAVDEEQENDEDGSTMSRPIQSSHADDWTRPASILAAPVHAIATPKPNLLFAIASDDVDQVRQVLENGEAGPNDSVGPQSALAFTLTNDKLAHKQEIVKTLLAYGANPSALRNPTLNPAPRIEEGESSDPPPETTLEGMDPATRYFVARADAAHTRQTSQLIYRSFFRPLTRVRYDVIGQDWALEQLFRVLSMHSQKLAVAPIVVLLCGPSGHGKSLLARKFGSLLDVPTHTVNMTTLQSTHDIWQSYSMSPYEEPSSCTLAEFLIENEGKRCVVVLDEIEKVEDQKALWSLLMPWELGRCSLEAGKRHVDARNVIWLGTSNVGHELVFEHHENRAEPDKRMSREDYLELTDMLRPRVSHCLGPSLVSRVTTVLPFVPFTLDEKKAISAEAVYALAGAASKSLSPQDVESLVTKALPNYHAGEGARSLHRAISNILIDTI